MSELNLPDRYKAYWNAEGQMPYYLEQGLLKDLSDARDERAHWFGQYLEVKTQRDELKAELQRLKGETK